MIIAIDGPAASGKGTLARKLAEHFNLPHLDTGSIYRALGLKVLEEGVDPNDIEAVCDLAKNMTEKDFKSDKLGTEQVGSMASKVAPIPKVREIFLDFQRNFAYNNRNAVLDGRDIGTVICPDADYKFFIIASVEERALRRHKDLIALGKKISYEEVLQQLKNRDKRDTERKSSPLKKSEDAIEVNTTNMTIEEVFKFVLSFIR